MNYRLAQLSDIPSLCSIENAQPRAARWGIRGWQTEITDKSAYVLCACEGQALVGFIALRLAAGVGEILNVAVAPAYCRRGVGQALLDQTLQWVRRNGGGKITLEVGAANLPALRLYQKMGFASVGVRKKFYHGEEDAFILGLQL